METKQLTGIGYRVETLKSLLSLSNKDLARAADITGQSVADLIEGKISSPKASTITAWVKKYNIRYEWILEGESPIFSDRPRNIDDSEEIQSPKITQMLTDQLKQRDKFIAELIDELGGKLDGISFEEGRVLPLYADLEEAV